MKCNVLNVVKVERESQLPYYVIRARGVEGDETANAVENGVINFAAMQSRVFNFTKCLFPGTEKQCEDLEKSLQLGKDGEVLNELSIYLTYYRYETGKKFYIYDSDGAVLTEQKEVEKVATKDGVINGKAVHRGQTYTDTEEVPRVFTSVSLTLFCDADGNITEGDGNPENLAKRNFEAGLASGRYELVTE